MFSAQNNDWHFHNPHLGQQSPSSESLLAYALDGYPIYGPLEDASGLDACNGRTVNGKYQYHVRVSSSIQIVLPTAQHKISHFIFPPLIHHFF